MLRSWRRPCDWLSGGGVEAMVVRRGGGRAVMILNDRCYRIDTMIP